MNTFQPLLSALATAAVLLLSIPLKAAADLDRLRDLAKAGDAEALVAAHAEIGAGSPADGARYRSFVIQSLQKLQRPDLALPLARAAAADAPNWGSQVRLARLLAEAGDRPAAIAAYRAAAKLAPGADQRLSWLIQAAELELDGGQPTAAVAALTALFGEATTHEQRQSVAAALAPALRAAKAPLPRATDLDQRRRLAYLQLADNDAAAAETAKGIAAATGSPADLALWAAAAAAGEPAARVEALKALVAAEPEGIEVLLSLARAHQAAGDLTAAIDSAGQLADKSPDAAHSAYLAALLAEQGNLTAAIEWYDRACQQDARQPCRWRLAAADLHLRAGAAEPAAAIVTEVLTVGGCEVQAWGLLRRLGKLDEHRQASELAWLQAPDNVTSLAKLVALMTFVGDHQAAIKYAIVLLTKDPSDRNVRRLIEAVRRADAPAPAAIGALLTAAANAEPPLQFAVAEVAARHDGDAAAALAERALAALPPQLQRPYRLRQVQLSMQLERVPQARQLLQQLLLAADDRDAVDQAVALVPAVFADAAAQAALTTDIAAQLPQAPANLWRARAAAALYELAGDFAAARPLRRQLTEAAGDSVDYAGWLTALLAAADWAAMRSAATAAVAAGVGEPRQWLAFRALAEASTDAGEAAIATMKMLPEPPANLRVLCDQGAAAATTDHAADLWQLQAVRLELEAGETAAAQQRLRRFAGRTLCPAVATQLAAVKAKL